MYSKILCFGAMHMDRLAKCIRPFMVGVSNPVSSDFAVGGVGFNICRNLKNRGQKVAMVSCVGNDPDGSYVNAMAKEWDIQNDLVLVSEDCPTATYTAILNNDGELAAGLSEMAIYDLLTIEKIEENLSQFYEYPFWVIDANLPAEAIKWLVEHKQDSKILAAPVSMAKAERWAQSLAGIDYWIGNDTEATILSGILVNDVESAKIAADKLCSLGPEVAVITLAADGVVMASKDILGHWSIPPTNVVDVNGAGDSFFAGFTSTIADGGSLEKAVCVGVGIASLTTEYSGPVRLDLSDEMLKEKISHMPKPDLNKTE